MKKTLLNTLKIGLPVAIIAALVAQAYRNKVFHDLASEGGLWKLNWGLLALALAALFAAVLITFVRWHYLVRALGLSISLHESVRIGLLGYLFNLAPMGIVAGDLLKAVMLSHRHPGCRAESLATVFADRVIGLWVLFAVASAGILATGLWQSTVYTVSLSCNLTLLLTVVGTVGIVVPLLPDVSGGRIAALTHRIPFLGRPIANFAGAVRMYRFHLPVLVGSAFVTIAVHSLITLSIFLIATTLYGSRVHSFLTHFVIALISNATSVIPVAAGPLEGMLNLLYADVPGGNMTLGEGTVVGLVFRLMTVLTASVGFVYYLASRSEVAQSMHEAEQLTEKEDTETSDQAACCSQGTA